MWYFLQNAKYDISIHLYVFIIVSSLNFPVVLDFEGTNIDIWVTQTYNNNNIIIQYSL